VTTKLVVEELVPSDTTTAGPTDPDGIVNEKLALPFNAVITVRGVVTAVTPPMVTLNVALAKKPDAPTDTVVPTGPLALLSAVKVGVTVKEVGERRGGAVGGSEINTGHAPFPMLTWSFVAEPTAEFDRVTVNEFVTPVIVVPLGISTPPSETALPMSASVKLAE